MLIFISLIFLAQNVAASVPQDGQKNHATPSGPANSADYPKEALKKGWEGWLHLPSRSTLMESHMIAKSPNLAAMMF
jgi:hypothetical protein